MRKLIVTQNFTGESPLAGSGGDAVPFQAYSLN